MSIQSTKSIRGFYHDFQKSNKLLRVSLHPNTILEKTEDGKEDWKWLGKDNYSEEPILVSIIKDDFQVGVSNNWTDFSAGDTITSLWNEFKPFAPYMSYAGEKLGEMYDTGENMRVTGNKAFDEEVVNFIHKGVGKLKGFADIGAEYLNRSLIVQGTRFSYYSGTGIAFGNLNMKVTIFADWKDGNFVDVNEQLENIYPYIMGKYEKMKSGNELLNNFFGWQKPPAGFKASVKDLDNVQEGTLQLRIGPFYCLSNLVVKDVQFNFSKQMVKDPTWNGKISPLYCDVDLSLQPATKYSDESLKKFVSGKGMEDVIKSTEEDLKNRLDMEKMKNEDLRTRYLKVAAKENSTDLSSLSPFYNK